MIVDDKSFLEYDTIFMSLEYRRNNQSLHLTKPTLSKVKIIWSVSFYICTTTKKNKITAHISLLFFYVRRYVFLVTSTTRKSTKINRNINRFFLLVFCNNLIQLNFFLSLTLLINTDGKILSLYIEGILIKIKGI